MYSVVSTLGRMPIAVLTMNATASASVSRGLGRRSIVATLVKELLWEPVDEHRGKCPRV
jgi:hypothetical protein